MNWYYNKVTQLKDMNWYYNKVTQLKDMNWYYNKVTQSIKRHELVLQ